MAARVLTIGHSTYLIEESIGWLQAHEVARVVEAVGPETEGVTPGTLIAMASPAQHWILKRTSSKLNDE